MQNKLFVRTFSFDNLIEKTWISFCFQILLANLMLFYLRGIQSKFDKKGKKKSENKENH